MSTITKEFTKEQLQQIIETDHVQCGEASALARIALASLESEPVGEVSEQRDGLVMDGTVDLGGASTHRIIKGASKMKRLPLGTKFYTTPPAPVSVPDAYVRDERGRMMLNGRQEPRIGYGAGWNAYRAAMLQGADRPQSAQQNIPENIPTLREAVDTIRSSGIAIDGEEIQAQRDCLNSPAIPDGWVACSERMPEVGSKVIVFRPSAEESNDPPVKTATYKGGREYYHGFDCYCEPTHWMPLPAAPQQEA